ncbi:hypothetical protein M436DRAFT_85867 [Aureobasidium namibiae CBS 147.97]|uniref:Uncharacterized protein n=1 Tax=Aureobasidium namibiae CBS 147.97 TaxID=1043004 RepID=A0A074WBI7_9PEZI
MPSTFPCATCGTALNGSTFEYQKHMTQCHWSGNNNAFPLRSIFTTSTLSPTAHIINWLDTTPAGCSATADSALAAPLTAFLWPSLQPTIATSYHYSPLYTNAAWAQMKSNTSADPCRPSFSLRNAWPPRSLDSDSGCEISPSNSEISPCERAAAARSSPTTAPTLKRKRSVDDCGGLERATQRLRLDSPLASDITPKVAEFLASMNITPCSGKRVYLRPVRCSDLSTC